MVLDYFKKKRRNKSDGKEVDQWIGYIEIRVIVQVHKMENYYTLAVSFRDCVPGIDDS